MQRNKMDRAPDLLQVINLTLNKQEVIVRSNNK